MVTTEERLSSRKKSEVKIFFGRKEGLQQSPTKSANKESERNATVLVFYELFIFVQSFHPTPFLYCEGVAEV